MIEICCEQSLPEVELPDWEPASKTTLSADRKVMTVQSPRPAKTLVELVKWIDQQGIELADVQLKRPSLEDVFIELTGKSLRE
jgi:ABC-2 type transport system ATP-binding protein